MGLIDIGISGLLAAQRNLTTIGHNIANVNTPGYSRQVVDISARLPELGGYGTGVDIIGVRRLTEPFLSDQLGNRYELQQQHEAYFTHATSIDSLLGDLDLAVTTGLENFFDALQVALDDPSSTASRGTFLSESDVLVSRFNSLYTQIEQRLDILNDQMGEISDQVNAFASSLAALNSEINSQGSNVPPDLLDQRDELINDLSKLVGISTIKKTNGAVDVFIGTGEILVLDGTASTLDVVSGTVDATQFDVAFRENSGFRRITGSIAGGEMGGLLNFREEVLRPAQRVLGRLALGLANDFNAQHNMGMDLNNSVNIDFFTDINTASAIADRVLTNPDNTGTGVMTATIAATNALVDSDYQFDIGVNTYTVTRLSDNTVVSTGSLSNTVPQTIPATGNIEGLSFNLASGTFVNGDSFIVVPTRFGARDIDVSVVSESSIALGLPIKTDADITNTGTATATAGTVTNISNASFTTSSGALTPPLRVEFVSATTYKIVNDTTGVAIAGVGQAIPYSPGVQNTIFPTPALAIGTAPSFSPVTATPTTLDVVNTGELIINSVAIGAAASDGVSTTQASGSALAVKNAIDAASITGITTTATTTLNLGAYNLGAIGAGELTINGVAITSSSTTADVMAATITTALSGQGIVASATGDNITLTAVDGRNIEMLASTTVSAGSFANFDLTAATAYHQVQRGVVSMTSTTTNITVAGTDPDDAYISSGTSTIYDPGYTFSISGAAEVGDKFSVTYNTDGGNDNRNGVSLAALQSAKNLSSGSSTYSDAYGILVTDVGTKTALAEINERSSQVLLDQALAERDSVAGVNLDQEAADLIQYEQAYQAAARIISVTNTIFDTLLSTIGR